MNQLGKSFEQLIQFAAWRIETQVFMDKSEEQGTMLPSRDCKLIHHLSCLALPRDGVCYIWPKYKVRARSPIFESVITPSYMIFNVFLMKSCAQVLEFLIQELDLRAQTFITDLS
ncbi:hypothetical protein PV328_003584 [Microctonus aethiopoides]|uniref:Uncharacterized protein n=1 Tax=Microctonus aethiopoides TaxID=144406 RepID=A0AA39KKT4_9HYME|nr:hypothetical protein PV328_003584 [Microctonus aethiopoides]